LVFSAGDLFKEDSLASLSFTSVLFRAFDSRVAVLNEDVSFSETLFSERFSSELLLVFSSFDVFTSRAFVLAVFVLVERLVLPERSVFREPTPFSLS